MGRNVIETILGAVVLMVAALFLVFAYSSADLKKVQGYTISAYFPLVDGIKEGTDVRMNGVKVGSISDLQLVTAPGPNQYKVDVKMTILPDIQLPYDTIAMIASESLLGGKYLALEVGIEEDLIKTDGSGRLTHTQSPMRLDDLIGQMIYGSKKTDAGTQKPAPAVTTGAAPPDAAIPSAPPKSEPVAKKPAAATVAKPNPSVYSPPPLPSPELLPAPAPDAAPSLPVEPVHP